MRERGKVGHVHYQKFAMRLFVWFVKQLRQTRGSAKQGVAVSVVEVETSYGPPEMVDSLFITSQVNS